MKKVLLLLPFLLLFAPAASASGLPDVWPQSERTAPHWALDQIDSEESRDGSFRSLFRGTGVDIYMLDTGVGLHSELGNRVSPGWSAWEGDGRSDCNGQGTASAVLAAGSTWGVAPGATVIPVRALDCNGEADGGNIEEALQWIMAHHTTRPAVVVVSANVPVRTEIDELVGDLYAEGVLSVVAAGDIFADACTLSPARSPVALTVGAVDSALERATFSGFSSCLDLWAPGKGIPVAEEGNPLPVQRSGTALSAALAGGLAALALERQPALQPQRLLSTLVARAREGAVGDPIDSPNRLLFAADLAWQPGTARYWPPAIPSPPAFSTTASAAWAIEDGYYSDQERWGTWLQGVSGWDTELLCQLRRPDGQVVLSRTISGAAEPSACSLVFPVELEDGVYSFVARKDLVSSDARIEGRERSVPFELDRWGPQVSWGDVPLRTGIADGNIIPLPLRVYDRLSIDGISSGDFLQEGTASCTLSTTVPNLPPGGGEFLVSALCSSEGTLQAALRAASFFSERGPGPASTVRTPEIVIDWTRPETNAVSGPPTATTSRSATFVFSSESGATFECRFGTGDWTACSSPHTVSSLPLGDHTFRVRARDEAGNEDSSPLIWNWLVETAPPSTNPPVNDSFASAKEINILSAEQSIWRGNTTYATREAGEPAHGAASVWFSWRAPSGGRLELSTQGSSFDTRLSLYRGTSLDSLVPVATSDDFEGNIWSRILSRVTGGEQYFVAVAGALGDKGAYTLRGQLRPLGAPRAYSYLRKIERFPASRTVRMLVGIRGREEGQSISVQCRRKTGSYVSPWTACSLRPAWRKLRRGRTHTLSVRIVVDGQPEKTPTRVRVGF